jgi:hypothetical protein
MLPGIRIILKGRKARLDRMSRVDFSRMYTVEYNVKVLDIGDVHRNHLGRLHSQWMTTITDGAPSTAPLNLMGLERYEEALEADGDLTDDPTVDSIVDPTLVQAIFSLYRYFIC